MNPADHIAALEARNARLEEALGVVRQIVEDVAYCVNATTLKSPFTDALNECHEVANKALTMEQTNG